MKSLWRALLVVFLLVPPVLSQVEEVLPFQKGRTRFSFTGGYGGSGDQSYLVLGVGGGYYLLDGLEAGLDGEAWLGQNPRLYQITPEVTYTLLAIDQFKPYVGGFYRRRIYEKQTGLDSVGARAGVAIPLSPRAYVSAGGVYENVFHCDTAVYSECSRFYPEAAISFSF